MTRTTQVWRIVQEWMDGQLVSVTQSKVADAIGVQRSALSQWKYGQARPTPANLRRVHEITRVPYRDLLDALLADMGYLSAEELMGNAEHPAPIEHDPDAAGRGVRARSAGSTRKTGHDLASPAGTVGSDN